MEFRTAIRPKECRTSMSHSDLVVLLGSCFSDNIGSRMRDAMMRVEVNPFGTLYNPMSIASGLMRLVRCAPVAGQDLFLSNGVWSSFDFHSRYSMASKEAALQRMNGSIERAHSALEQCQWLIITLGTSVVYRRRDNGMVAANCHKVPQHEFTRRMASVDEMAEALGKALDTLHEFNPAVNVVFTISPIRHIADGLETNSLSKAALRLAVENVRKERKAYTHYFPAYEIMLDDLRDYRFYAADMVHPTDVAVEYIWQTFQATFLDDQSGQAIARCERVSKRLKHRPMSNNPDIVQRFNADTKAVVNNLIKAYPYLQDNEQIAELLN